MTQEEVNLIFNITILIHEHPWFKEKKRTRNEVQNWVTEKLAENRIYTVPVGMSWGVLCNKETYDDSRRIQREPS